MCSSPSTRVGWLALALIVSVSGSVRAASPEDEDLSKARGKFMQATELEQGGNYASALQVYREVAQVRMTPQVRYHIASCEEKLGKLLAALGGYELAMGSEAEALGPEFQKEVEERANSLRKRIPKLIIERGEGAQAATIELDGVSLGASSIGVEVSLNPGPHAVSAKAPGYKVFSSTVEVPEKQVERVTVTLERLSETDGSGVNPNTSGPLTVSEPEKHSRVVPYVIGGVGAAALVNAGVFYILQRGKDSELSDLCGSDHKCNVGEKLSDPELEKVKTLKSRLDLYSTITTVSLVAGIVAVGTAAVLILTEPKAPKPQAAWFFAPEAPGANIGGLSLGSHF